MGITTVPNVYAEAISSHYNLQVDNSFVVLKGNNTICVINQAQLNLLKTNYRVEIKQIMVNGQPVTTAEIINSPASPNKIYSLLGLNKSGHDKCTVIKQNKSFFFFLTPGVS